MPAPRIVEQVVGGRVMVPARTPHPNQAPGDRKNAAFACAEGEEEPRRRGAGRHARSAAPREPAATQEAQRRETAHAASRRILHAKARRPRMPLPPFRRRHPRRKEKMNHYHMRDPIWRSSHATPSLP